MLSNWFFFSVSISSHKNHFIHSIQKLTADNKNMNRRTNEEEIKVLSKPLIGSPVGLAFRAGDRERFKAKFGISTNLCSLVWNKMVEILDLRMHGFRLLSPLHLLYGLFFLKVYPTSRQAIGTLGSSVGQHLFTKYAKFIIRQIAALKSHVVSEKRIFYIYLILLIDSSIN